jgi:carboxymethylenebutenolidase
MGDIRIEAADGGTFEAYLALPPDAAPAPGLVLLPPIFGIEPVIRRLADGYAARGFVVVAPNQFWRDSVPQTMERTDAGRAIALARGKRVDVESVVADLGATVAALRAMAACSGKIAVLGFCFGGRYAYIAAARLPVEAAAAFHGAQIGLSLSPAPRVSVSLHFGEDDPVAPMTEVDAIKAVLRQAQDDNRQAQADVYVYPGTTHNFAVPGVPGYDAAVAKLSEDRVFTLFEGLRDVR